MSQTSAPRGWVADEPTRQERAQQLSRRLAGRRIERVRYIELAYDGYDAPMWPGPDFDSLDFGLELDLDDGVTWGILWQQDGYNETLLVSSGHLEDLLQGRPAMRTWNATEHWHEHGPTLLDGVTSVWTRHSYGPARNRAGEQVSKGGESGLCLLTLVLSASSGREAVISLGGRKSVEEGYWYVADNVVVFFSADEARRARVYLPGDADAIV